MNGCLGLGECKELEVFASKSIPERCSFKAVDANGQIVGVAINGVVKKPVSSLTFTLTKLASNIKFL